MLRKNQIITQELQNAPQPLKTKSNFMTPEVKNYAIEEFMRKYHNPKKLCQYDYILSILRESLTGEEIIAKELSKKILEEYESDFLKSIDIEYMIKNCRKYLQNFETDHNYLISIKINQNTCIAEMERYLTLLEKADPNYLNRYYVEYEPNRTGNWQEFERFWQEWKSLNQPPKALLKKMEDELSKRNQELEALPHNMQPQYVLQIVTHIKELEKCIELFKLNREELFQLITKKSWDLTAIYVQIINKCSNLKICLESKEIGDNHSSKLEHIKLPITFIDSKTLEIFCKILENKLFFKLILQLPTCLIKSQYLRKTIKN